MSITIEKALTRTAPAVDRRSWLRWGAVTFLTVETIHFTVGALGPSAKTPTEADESLGVFLENLAAIVVSGTVITALVFGTLVRWGLKPSPRGRNRTATTSLAAGLLAIAAYTVYFTWAQWLIAPAAVLLGQVGLTRAQDGLGGRARALAGVLIGLASLGFSAAVLAYAFVHGDYPQWMPW
jgi:hypothetical protein